MLLQGRDSQLTPENVRVLAVQVIGIPGGVIEVPYAIEVANLRGPDVAAAVGVGIGVDDLWLRCLEPLNGLGAGDLKVCPLGRNEVVVPSGVSHLQVTTARVANGVREGLGRGLRGQSSGCRRIS